MLGAHGFMERPGFPSHKQTPHMYKTRVVVLLRSVNSHVSPSVCGLTSQQRSTVGCVFLCFLSVCIIQRWLNVKPEYTVVPAPESHCAKLAV